jgi:hypothetical protein
MSLGMAEIPDYHKRLQEDHEHDRDWMTCLDCGAQWAAHSSGYEQVTEGDDYCLENTEEE